MTEMLIITELLKRIIMNMFIICIIVVCHCYQHAFSALFGNTLLHRFITKLNDTLCCFPLFGGCYCQCHYPLTLLTCLHLWVFPLFSLVFVFIYLNAMSELCIYSPTYLFLCDTTIAIYHCHHLFSATALPISSQFLILDAIFQDCTAMMTSTSATTTSLVITAACAQMWRATSSVLVRTDSKANSVKLRDQQDGQIQTTKTVHYLIPVEHKYTVQFKPVRHSLYSSFNWPVNFLTENDMGMHSWTVSAHGVYTRYVSRHTTRASEKMLKVAIAPLS